MRLAEFISDHLEEILQEFEDFARTHTAAGGAMDPTSLRDHAKGILEAVARDLQQPQSQSEQERKGKGEAPSPEDETPAARHGAQRAGEAFSLAETVAEFRALRASVLRLWPRAADDAEAHLALQDVTRFNEAIDQALSESVNRYAVELGRLRDERATEGDRIAEGVEQMKTDFLQVVSHELRTPLNAISGYGDMLRMEIRGPLNEEQRSMLWRMKKAEHHLLGVIEGILDFQRAKTGKIPFKVEEMTVQDALEGLESIVEPMAKQFGVEFSMEIEPGEVRGRVDHARLRQVLLNLISNAMRHTPEGGRVWLDHLDSSDEICLRVHDTGTGIPQEKLEAIFQPFVQLDMGLTREQGGIGLGLAISRQFMHGMGGRITATSRPGEGSIFTVHVPRQNGG